MNRFYTETHKDQQPQVARLELKSPHLFRAEVMHKRVKPVGNAFQYGLYYLVLPVNHIDNCQGLPLNRRGVISFWERDHGARSEVSLKDWIYQQLEPFGLRQSVADVLLVAMPRVLGYGFNPVSFWLCLDDSGQLVAVLCEVNNTFGETHCYLCRPDRGGEIQPDEWLMAEKVFHVSPFLPRNGHYKFKFTLTGKTLSVSIHYFDKVKERTLITALNGSLQPLTQTALRKLAYQFPLVTIKTIFLIHWQALKLWMKKCRFYKKPKPISMTLTSTVGLNQRSNEGQESLSNR